MRIKKTTKPGECVFMRCTKQASAETLLCPAHEAKWREAGCPALTAETTAERKSEMVLDSRVQQDLENERQRTIDAIKLAQSMSVETPAHRDRLASFVNKAKDRKKTLEEQRKSVTGPMNAAIKTINGWFRPLSDSLDAFIQTGQNKIEVQLTKERAEQRAALAEIEAGAGSAPAAAFALAHRQVEAPAGTAERVEYSVELVNPEIIPRAYWVLDQKKVLADLRVGIIVPGAKLVETLGLVKART